MPGNLRRMARRDNPRHIVTRDAVHFLDDTPSPLAGEGRGEGRGEGEKKQIEFDPNLL